MNRAMLPHQWLIFFAAVLLTAFGSARSTTGEPFYMGADLSMVPFLESRGAVYRDDGMAKPAEQIFADHGANMFRLRLFVNPSLNYDAPNNRGAIQNLDYVIDYAQRIKATGGKFMLAMHYSDTWTNPGLQGIPSGWPSSSGQFEQLKTRVHDYTVETLTALKNAGVMPDVVQIGNETTSGMLWPRGQVVYTSQPAQIQGWQNYGQLVNSAISAVREMQDPGQHIDVAVTIAPGDEWYSAAQGGLPRWFANNFHNVANVTDYDILGIDSYPETQGRFVGLINNLNDLATHFDKKIMVAETSYPWNHTLDGTGPGDYDGFYNPTNEPFPTTQAGQLEFLTTLRDAVRNLPNGRGYGLLWWYPEAVPVPNTYMWKGGALGLFDSQGNALPSMDAFYLAEGTQGDFNNDGTVDAADYVVWRKGLGETYTPNYLNIWRSKFGNSLLGNGANNQASVPEPATTSILCLLITWALRRRSLPIQSP